MNLNINEFERKMETKQGLNVLLFPLLKEFILSYNLKVA